VVNLKIAKALGPAIQVLATTALLPWLWGPHGQRPLGRDAIRYPPVKACAANSRRAVEFR
jgi:hypothetical protein